MFNFNLVLVEVVLVVKIHHKSQPMQVDPLELFPKAMNLCFEHDLEDTRDLQSPAKRTIGEAVHLPGDLSDLSTSSNPLL